MIERNIYIDELKKWKDENVIKIVTGIRRCGKSTIFEIFTTYLQELGVDDEHIISINLEDPMYNFADYLEFYNYVLDMVTDNKKYYIFIDEVQNINDFQKAIDGLFIKKNIDLYITGSNAYLLSGSLSTLLTGRYIEIKMHPLSFSEYFLAYDEKNTDVVFDNYLKFGSFPEVVHLVKKDENMVNKYLDSIFTTVVYKDIILNNNIKDAMILESILKYILENVGSQISIKKITDTLCSMNRKTTNPTVESYVKAFIDSFILIKIDRFDVHEKNTLSSGYKYYCVDSGFINYLSKKKPNTDLGHLIENIVCIELKRRGFDVYVGKNKEFEIDFVAKKNHNIEYYQVAYTIQDDQTFTRETRALEKIDDNYPKFILTLDKVLYPDFNGIKIVNLIDWLLDV